MRPRRYPALSGPVNAWLAPLSLLSDSQHALRRHGHRRCVQEHGRRQHLEPSALVIDPTTPSTVYAAADGGVFKSTDSGNTWHAFNAGLSYPLSVQTIAVDPTRPGRLYAGTVGGGVFSIQQGAICVGDCTANDQVTVDELLAMVKIALGGGDVATCRAGDAVPDGQIAVDEILLAVNFALVGCGR